MWPIPLRVARRVRGLVNTGLGCVLPAGAPARWLVRRPRLCRDSCVCRLCRGTVICVFSVGCSRQRKATAHRRPGGARGGAVRPVAERRPRAAVRGRVRRAVAWQGVPGRCREAWRRACWARSMVAHATCGRGRTSASWSPGKCQWKMCMKMCHTSPKIFRDSNRSHVSDSVRTRFWFPV